MSDVAEVRAAVERLQPVEDVVTQEDVDAALVEAEEAVQGALDVRDIPGVLTIAHSDDLEEWRRVRSQGSIISATAMTTVMGTNPFSSVMDLWRERMEGVKPVFSRFSLTVMNYGTLAEPELLEEANRFVSPEPHFVLTHGFVVWEEDQRFGSTPDAWRFALREGESRETGGTRLELAEFKTGSKSWRKTPRSKPVVPANYYDQTQWQMLTTGAERVLVIYRQVKRDKQGNVVEVLGHERIWVERDEKRIAQMIEAANAWLQDEHDLVPPMTYIDTEDQFDDAPEVTARKTAIRQALADVAHADRVLGRQEFVEAQEKRDAALATLKGIMRAEKGRQVLLREGGYGATLSRSTRTGYDAKLLTEKQRERIRTTTTVESLRVTADKGE
ncbi:exonuclease [Microbacterium phage DelaGarza]|nr:exonuclease [Microbacterium phage DelaGarza]